MSVVSVGMCARCFGTFVRFCARVSEDYHMAMRHSLGWAERARHHVWKFLDSDEICTKQSTSRDGVGIRAKTKHCNTGYSRGVDEKLTSTGGPNIIVWTCACALESNVCMIICV